MIETARLILRRWRPADAAAHHAVAADAQVAAVLGSAPTLVESRARIEAQEAGQAQHGFCFWAVERRADARVIGWCGLQHLPEAIGGGVEIGWTVAPDLWGRGYAREAAAAALHHGWVTTTLNRVLAVTTPGNLRSRQLMERLGMIRLPFGDFDHPALAPGDPLRRHVTYAIERPR